MTTDNALSAREWLLLRDCPLFTGLTEAELAEALAFFEARRTEFSRGELLHRPGEPLPRFGLLLSGAVRVGMDDLDGNPMLMNTVVPGETFGEAISFLAVEDSPVTISAEEDAAVLLLSTARLRCLPENPGSVGFSLLQRFTAMVARRTLTMNDRIQVLSRSLLRDRLLTFFTQCEHRYGGKLFRLPFDRAEMALYLGTNRSALSRELAAMQRDGLLEFYRSSFRIL